MRHNASSSATSESAEPPPAHKRRWGIDLWWRAAAPEHTMRGDMGASAYVEVDSPLDQNRVGGDGPRPWADEPRYAWATSNNNRLHVAGWMRTLDRSSGNHIGWRIIDVYLPWDNVIKLQVQEHDDWEDKDASNDG